MYIADDSSTSFFGDATESTAYPNVSRFLSSYNPHTQPCTEIDVITFCEEEEPKIESDLSNLDSRAPPLPGASELFIVEDISPPVAEYLLQDCVGEERSSFLQLLEDFLDDHPSYTVDDLHSHFPPRQSVLSRRRHLCFPIISIRQFDRHFHLDWQRFLSAVRAEKLSGKSEYIYGIFLPAQRTDRFHKPVSFPPGVLSRNQFAAWFDGHGNEHWKRGVILVDRLPRLRILSASLQSPSYNRVARDDGEPLEDPDTSSYRSALSFYIKSNAKRAPMKLQSRFLVLEEMYRIIASEWIVTNTYFTRDLNAIGWTISNSQTMSGNELVNEIDINLDKLFMLQQRLTRYPEYLKKVLQSCRASGHMSWKPTSLIKEEILILEKSVAAELVDDFEQVMGLLAQNASRVEQSIQQVVALSSLIHSKLGMQETARTVTQNKLLTTLSFVAIFFLPISSASAIFSMQGDWAPGESKFGLFWAIVLPLSASLLTALVIFRYWNSIRPTTPLQLRRQMLSFPTIELITSRFRPRQAGLV